MASNYMFLFVTFILVSGLKLSESTNFTIVNNCKETIWPGMTPDDNYTGGGFALKPGKSAFFYAPLGWHGRIWGRTGCNFDKNGNGSCETGGCGNNIKCLGPGQPPASIADFTLGDVDYYDVSLVDGFNLPIVVKPINGKGNCSAVGCDSDLRANCPSDLALKSGGEGDGDGDGRIIACRSACNVFNTDEFCCRGTYSTPVACLPTNYSASFKTACPAAYSFAYDDPTSIVTCSTSDYVVTFCSSRNETQCTYHDNKLTCNGAEGIISLWKIWTILILTLSTLINFHQLL